MGFNNYTYTVIKYVTGTDTFVDEKKYPKPAKNNNSTLIIVDKKDQSKETMEAKFIPVKPSFVTEAFPDWPYLSHEEARKLIKYQASSATATDGWDYGKKIVSATTGTGAEPLGGQPEK